jgi:hypothetical protein
MDMGRYVGEGEYTFPDGSKYIGEFKNGMFHGKGKMVLPTGTYYATWNKGKVGIVRPCPPSRAPEIDGVPALQEVEGSFTFDDGLDYEDESWQYCTKSDRRFATEFNTGDGVKPAGEVQYTDKTPAFRIPIDCYDTGDGYYDPLEQKVFDYEAKDEDGERKVVREPDEDEVKWIVAKCRVGIL